MSIENNAENIQDDVTMEFPCITVENDKNTIFSWVDDGLKKPSSDRAFAIQTENMPSNSLPLLFQITNVNEKSAEASKRLWKLHMCNPEVYEVLVSTGLGIVEEVNTIFFTDKTPISAFSKVVKIENDYYRITYMPESVKLIDGTSMRDNYVNRIEKKRRR